MIMKKLQLRVYAYDTILWYQHRFYLTIYTFIYLNFDEHFFFL